MKQNFTEVITGNNKSKVSGRGNGQEVAEWRERYVPESRITGTRAVD